MAGDVAELQEQLADLARTNEEYRPFVAKLQKLAKGFRLNNIRDMLEGYLAEGNES
jgi:hypothetical protein